MEDYKVIKGENEIKVFEKESGYSIVISENKANDLGQIHFLWPLFAARKGEVMSYIPITASGIDKYPEKVRNMKINPSFQYLEVGAGYGEFIPCLASALDENSPKPIVIDPAYYDVMGGILSYVRNNVWLSESNSSLLDEIIARHDIITNPRKVRLINTNLGYAFRDFPDIQGIADVVVDRAGAVSYAELERVNGEKLNRAVLNMRVSLFEKRLLKNGGELITLGHC
jgi:hypothetical protein